MTAARRALGLAAAAALLFAALAARTMIRAYRGSQLEFHLPPTAVGPPPADLPRAQAVSFPSRDGARLEGWWVQPERAATVLLLDGSGSDRRQLLPEARALAPEGFGVLMFDWPGIGASGGRVTLSVSEAAALRGALDFVEQRAPGTRIGALGFSMGAGVLVPVAAGDARLRAVIAEAPVLDLDDEVTREFARWGPLSYLPAQWAKRAEGWDPAAPRPLETVKGLAGRPLLIINGSADALVPESDARRLFAAAAEPKQLWVIAGAAHGGYAALVGKAYLDRVVAFFKDAFPFPLR